MASPFKFFRKHQTGMMVVLVILAMLVFTLDALFTQQGANFWLLGMLLGGAVFGIAGIGSGRWLQWGLGGGVLGALLGLIMPELTRPPGVVATKFGIIEQEDLQDLIDRRNVANGFMMLAKEAAFGAFARQLPPQFSFQHSTQREDVLFGRLMSEEADALGITVSDDMVNAFVNEQTADKLSGELFGEARRSLSYQGSPVRSDTLFDILREQIRCQLAFRSLVPFGSVSAPSPEVYWEYFQRLNVKQVINVAELDVDAFLDQVPEPTDAEIEDLFASAATKQPNQDAPGSPGFLLPGRARIAWLEVNYDSVEATVPPVTDEEVEAYYQENRDIRYRTVVVPDTPADDSEADSDADDSSEEGSSEDTGENKPEESADSDSEPDDSESSEASPADSPSDSPAGPEDQPEPADDDAPADEPSEETSSPAEPETPAEESASDSSPDGAQFSIDDPEGAADESSSEESADDAQAADDTESADDAEAADEAGDGDDTASDSATTESASPPPLVLPKMTEDQAAGEEPQVELEYEYRELDEELRAEIRDQLLAERVRAAMEEKINEALGFMQKLRREMSGRRSDLMKADTQKFLDDPEGAALELREQMTALTPDLLQQMRTWAEENDCVFAATKLVSYLDFRNEDDYPLGVALDPSVPRFQAQGGATIAAYNLFSRFDSADVAANDTQLLMPERAVYEPIADEGTESQYAYWAVEFVEPHVPTLDEQGVRDQVILAFKRAKARELVAGSGEDTQGRAQVLAQKVRDGLAAEGDDRSTMAATLESESITGKEGSATLTVRTSQPFSWLRQSQAAANSFQQRPQAEMSRIRFSDGFSTLDGVDQEFMKKIFVDMNDEDVGVVPNFDRTSYFIVHVTNRFPTPDQGMDGLRQRFAGEAQMDFMTSPVPGLMVREVVNPVVIEWEKKMWLKYDVDPDAEPDQS